MEPFSLHIGQRIRDLRKKQGLTQEQLGEKLDLNYKFIGMIERGERLPSIKTLARIADTLNVEIKELFDFPKSQKAGPREQSLYRIWGFLKDRPKKELELAERMLRSLFKEG